MESIYLRAEEEVRRRRQRLNLLRGVRVGLTVSLGLTALYGISWTFGLWGTEPPSGGLLLLGNALGAGLGALWGRRLPVPLADDLYRVDRALRLDEKLVTICELRRRGETELLRALYRQLDNLRGRLGPENMRRALALPPSERRAWLGTGGLALLSLGILSLWMGGLGPISWEKLFSGSPLSEIVKAPGPLPPHASELPPEEERRQGNGEGTISQSPGDSLTDEARKNLCRRDRAAATSLTEEQWAELCEGQEGGASSEEASAMGDTAQAQALEQALAQLLERLVSGEISAEQARSELQSLLEEIPPGELREALEWAAQAADEQELRERIQDALSQLARHPQSPAGSESQPQPEPEPGEPQSPGQAGPETQSSSGTTSSEESQNETSQPGSQGSSGSGPAQPSKGQDASSADSQSEGDSEASETAAGEDDPSASTSEESGDPQTSASAPSESDSSAAGESSDNSDNAEASVEETGGKDSQTQAGAESESESESGSESQAASDEEGEETAGSGSEGEGAGSGGGSESPESESESESESETEGDRPSSGIGTGEGPDASESPPEPWTNLEGGLLIQSGDLPRDAQLLNRLFAKGLPVDLVGQGEDGTPVVVLNLARFESLLEARDLPPELRALVRAYFLAIAGSQGKKTEKGGKP